MNKGSKQHKRLLEIVLSVEKNAGMFIGKLLTNTVELDDVEVVFPILKGVCEGQTDKSMPIDSLEEAQLLMNTSRFKLPFLRIIDTIVNLPMEDEFE
ncbi:MAG: hypothetical protein O3B78_06920 [Bacteroidetes bacterium]|nr:hypothetical protein [Bacteroidota bacterium]